MLHICLSHNIHTFLPTSLSLSSPVHALLPHGTGRFGNRDKTRQDRQGDRHDRFWVAATSPTCCFYSLPPPACLIPTLFLPCHSGTAWKRQAKPALPHLPLPKRPSLNRHGSETGGNIAAMSLPASWLCAFPSLLLPPHPNLPCPSFCLPHVPPCIHVSMPCLPCCVNSYSCPRKKTPEGLFPSYSKDICFSSPI